MRRKFIFQSLRILAPNRGNTAIIGIDMKHLDKQIQRLLLIGLGALAPSLIWVTPVHAKGVQFDYVHLVSATTKSGAAETATARYGGKVLKVEEVNEGGRKVYRVKLLLNGGRIKIVTVDADSGDIS